MEAGRDECSAGAACQLPHVRFWEDEEGTERLGFCLESGADRVLDGLTFFPFVSGGCIRHFLEVNFAWEKKAES